MPKKSEKNETKKEKKLTPMQCIAVVKDSKKTVEERISAICNADSAILEKEEHFKEVLNILENPNEPLDVRLAALKSVQAATFQIADFEKSRRDYISTLRKVARGPVEVLRKKALGILSRQKDNYAQKKLIEGLNHPEKALVAPEKALQFLGNDIHADAHSAARKIVKKPPNKYAKREALRLLASDTSAVKLFERVLRDKEEIAEHRQISAVALHSMKPKTLLKHAKEIVQDISDSEDIQETCLTALTEFGEAAIKDDKKLMKHVRQLKTKGKRKVKKLARQFVAKYE